MSTTPMHGDVASFDALAIIPESPARRLLGEAYSLIVDGHPSVTTQALDRVAELVGQARSTLPTGHRVRAIYLDALLTHIAGCRSVFEDRGYEPHECAHWERERREHYVTIESLIWDAEMALESEDEANAVGVVGEAAQ